MSNQKVSRYRDIFGATEFLLADFRDFVYPRHVHETFAIGVIESGAQRFVTKAAREIMPEHKLCVVDPDIVHEGWGYPTTGWRYRMFYPSAKTVSVALGESTQVVERLGFGRFVLDDPELFSEFRAFHAGAMAAHDPMDVEQRAISFIQAIFARHAGHRTANSKTDSRVATLCSQYIDGNVAKSVSIADLAEIAGVSETHVHRSFKAHFGLSPHAFLIARRIERAKGQLAKGMDITDVSLDCGFVDQSHLHRHFRKIVGVTPGAFARSALM